VARGAARPALSGVIAAVFAISALVTLRASRGQHLAWPVFVAIAVAAWFSGR